MEDTRSGYRIWGRGRAVKHYFNFYGCKSEKVKIEETHQQQISKAAPQTRKKRQRNCELPSPSLTKTVLASRSRSRKEDGLVFFFLPCPPLLED
eukprot:scaffold203085_cov30-Tisochrysis_lutea.AAC.1